MPSMYDGYSVVNLGFIFKYFDREYTQVSISSNGYVCLGNNLKCDRKTRPSPYDILVGLNYELDTTLEESGQIYYKHLDSNSSDLESAKIFVNFVDPDFEPENIFMITYDNVLPFDVSFTSTFGFQIFLSSSENSQNSFVLFKFTSCPKYLDLEASSGVTYKNNEGILQEVIIAVDKQCTGSNVNQTGVWVIDVTKRGNF